MPKADQQAFIRSMVERLAGRLRKTATTWTAGSSCCAPIACCRSGEKAKTALGDARRALAGKPADAARVNALATELNIER